MAFMALAETDLLLIVGIVVGVLAVIIIAMRIIFAVRNKKQVAQQQQIDAAIDEGVQERLMEIRNEYFVMARNVTYSVGNDGQIKPGKYMLVSAVDNEEAFNLRVNGLVREYHNGDTMMLADMDTLCPVSGAVLIKPVV